VQHAEAAPGQESDEAGPASHIGPEIARWLLLAVLALLLIEVVLACSSATTRPSRAPASRRPPACSGRP